ncbi:hypothetical protein HMPREF9413_5737 [Paenibacillus sp. HGF7]|nr:hypothetical protein HMPREF9413_5737 [Paenibacillus sp. HGF7]
MINSHAIHAARASAIYTNTYNPNTNKYIADELAEEIGKIFPVSSTTITYDGPPVIPSSVGIKELRININRSDGSYITLSYAYGMPMPASGLLDRIGYVQTTPIPLNNSFSYQREW